MKKKEKINNKSFKAKCLNFHKRKIVLKMIYKNNNKNLLKNQKVKYNFQISKLNKNYHQKKLTILQEQNIKKV